MSRSDPLDPARAAELAGLPESRLRDELAALLTHGAAAAPLLQVLAEEAGDKGVRKLARAALHRLRAGGARIEAPLRAANVLIKDEGHTSILLSRRLSHHHHVRGLPALAEDDVRARLRQSTPRTPECNLANFREYR